MAFVSRPATFSSDDKRESDTGEAEVKEKDEKKSSRKQRYSSEDRSFEKENNDHVGSRYWGGSVEESRKDRFDYQTGKSREFKSVEKDVKENEEGISKSTKKTKEIDPILTRTGGAYIPPAKLKMMQAKINDK